MSPPKGSLNSLPGVIRWAVLFMAALVAALLTDFAFGGVESVLWDAVLAVCITTGVWFGERWKARGAAP